MYILRYMKQQQSFFITLAFAQVEWVDTSEVVVSEEKSDTPLWMDDAQVLAEDAWTTTARLDTGAETLWKEARKLRDGMSWGDKEEAPVQEQWNKTEKESSSEVILQEFPASDAERLAAEAAVIAAGWDISDSSLVDAAIISQRWETPEEAREISPEEQKIVEEGLLASFAPNIDMDPKTLRTLYEFNAENNSEFNPETIGKDIESFANEMQKLQVLTEKIEWLEMPTNQEEYNALMKQLEQFRWEDGSLEIPLSPEEIAAMWIRIDDNGNITLPTGTSYWSWDTPPWMPYANSRWQVVSGARWGARYEGWSTYTWGVNRMSIDLENLTPWVDGLVDMIYKAEANGDPDMIYGGSPIQPPKPLTEMTVKEVRSFQDAMVRAGSRSSAVWACQVIRTTMDGAIRSGLLDPNEKFGVEAQKRFTIGKMTERGLERFKSGQINEMTFMKNLSMEWASFPKDMSGVSYYAWDGLNKALVSPQAVLAQLRTIRWEWIWTPSETLTS